VTSRAAGVGHKPAASCGQCYAWGVHDFRDRCKACWGFARSHLEGECAGCRRLVPLKRDYCRLCWKQAGLDAKGEVTVLAPYLAKLRHHQLFMADMRRAVGRRGHPPRRNYRQPPSPPPASRPFPAGIQLRLFQPPPRDLRGFDRARHGDVASPWLARARQAVSGLAEAHGWTRGVAAAVDRALVIVLSGHAHGDQVRYSEIFAAVRARGLSVERTAEVLAHLDLLNDDRQASFERWLQQSLHQLAPGICRDVEAWLRTLHDGGPRTRPRSPDTVWGYARWVKPALLEWSARYDHLREVTREDVLAALKARHGWEHASTLSALRSLFRCCKRRGVIFGDPTSRIHLGRHPTGMILPLAPGDIAEAVAAATTPAARLLLALAAVHAARRKAMRELRLDDVDLGGRRLTIAGRVRPLDDLTRRAILDWLAYRRQRWAQHRQPAPADQPADRDGDRHGQHRVDQPDRPRPDRYPGAPARRPPARRGPDPRPRPAPSGGGVRLGRADRHPLRHRRTPTP
jgi:hypothetical protein